MSKQIVDLFCGCGGLSRGFEMAGFTVTRAIDMWADAVKTYNHNTPGNKAVCEDVHNWDNDFLRELNAGGSIVGVIGGPPCQGYSTVGTRDVNDPRNHLYLEYCRIVEALAPEFFVIENVKGLTTLSKGAFRDDIITRFERLGYTVTYRILNAADYGVPQNRLRVFFVGMRKGRFDFDKIPRTSHIVTASEAIGDLPSPVGAEKIEYYTSEPQTDYERQIRAGSDRLLNHEGTAHTAKTREIISLIKDGGRISDLPEEYWHIRKYNKAFERMASDRPSNTVDTGHRNYFHYHDNRIPTVRENARLQSFPDTFEVLGTKTSQYKQIGNAVPPLLAYAVACEIMNVLDAQE